MRLLFGVVTFFAGGWDHSTPALKLLQDNELRYFHDEYNDRTWKHGFGSLPSSFNVLEGFFKWNPKLFYFELIDEVEKSDTRTTPGRFQLTILMPWCY